MTTRRDLLFSLLRPWRFPSCAAFFQVRVRRRRLPRHRSPVAVTAMAAALPMPVECNGRKRGARAGAGGRGRGRVVDRHGGVTGARETRMCVHGWAWAATRRGRAGLIGHVNSWMERSMRRPRKQMVRDTHGLRL